MDRAMAKVKSIRKQYRKKAKKAKKAQKAYVKTLNKLLKGE
jgi:hypothetical protein